MTLMGWCQAPIGARPDHAACIRTFTRSTDATKVVTCSCMCHNQEKS